MTPSNELLPGVSGHCLSLTVSGSGKDVRVGAPVVTNGGMSNGVRPG